MPDDGAVYGRAGLAVPDQRRLALIGDPDRRDIAWGQFGRLERTRNGPADRLPDIFGFVLDPAAVGKMLVKFLLRLADHLLFGVKDKGPR